MTGGNGQDPCQLIYREKRTDEAKIASPKRYTTVNFTTPIARPVYEGSRRQYHLTQRTKRVFIFSINQSPA